MDRVPIANLKGPQGEDGPRGLPGVNGVANDEAMSELLEDSETATGAMLRAKTIAKGELIFNVKDFGAIGSGHSSTDDTAAIQAALDAAFNTTGIDLGASRGAVRGAQVYFPPGAYRTTAPLKYRGYVSLRGAGTQTSRLFNDTTDLFAWGDGDGVAYEAHTSDIWFSTGLTGGHIFHITGGATVGIARTKFDRVKMTTSNATSSIWKQEGRSQLIDIQYDRCIFDTQENRSVPAFDVSVGGNDANSVQWTHSWCHSHGGGATPSVPARGAAFFRIESTGAWNYNLSFRDLVGEQNAGGFIHVHAVDGLVIENCPDWDLVGPYTDDVYKVAGVSTRAPRNVRIESSYRLTNGGGLAAGKVDIAAPAAGNLNVRIVGCAPQGQALAATLAGDAAIAGKTQGFKIVTASVGLVATDPEEIVFNSATPISVTLPTPLSSIFGRQFRLKNVGAGTVTLTGATVDGVASPTLAQWSKMAIRTDGANANFGRIWFTV